MPVSGGLAAVHEEGVVGKRRSRKVTEVGRGVAVELIEGAGGAGVGDDGPGGPVEVDLAERGLAWRRGWRG